jgi:hypothetical protein
MNRMPAVVPPIRTAPEEQGHDQGRRQRHRQDQADQILRVHSFSTARTASDSSTNSTTVNSTYAKSAMTYLPLLH